VFAIAGGAVGGFGFVFKMSTSKSTTVNAQLTSFEYRDWFSIACGVVAIVLGIITLSAARKEQLRRALAFAAGNGVILLGGLQLARGFGVFEAAGEGAGTSSAMSMAVPTLPSAQQEPVDVQEPQPKGDPTSPTTCPSAQTCFDLGASLFETDAPSATKAFDRSCELGSVTGCFNSGVARTKRKPPDLATAATFFDKACEGGDATACNALGQLSRSGDAGKKDLVRAAKLFQRACDAGEIPACSNLGVALDNAEGVKKDSAKALIAFEKACNAGDPTGDPEACSNLGILYHAGRGTKKNLAKARELYETACQRSVYGACVNLGIMRRDGQGGKKDKPGAKAVFKEACDGGVEKGCKLLAKLK
jgi:hypothetical protein